MCKIPTLYARICTFIIFYSRTANNTTLDYTRAVPKKIPVCVFQPILFKHPSILQMNNCE